MNIRNQKCHCGSGKKFKKCCLQNEQNSIANLIQQLAQPIIKVKKEVKLINSNIKYVEKNFDRINKPYKVFKERGSIKEEIRCVSNIYNLPIELQSKLSDVILEYPPFPSQCIAYSQYISSSIEGVKVEIGLFKTDGVANDFPYDNPKKNQWYEYNNGIFDTTTYVDENGDLWGIHCWNSYKGCHFDCIKDLIIKDRNPKQWIRYKKLDDCLIDSPNERVRVAVKNKLINFMDYDKKQKLFSYLQ